MVNQYQQTGWYYESRGERRGPVPVSSILALYNAGIIKNDTHVYTQGFSDWKPFSQSGLVHSSSENSHVGNQNVNHNTVVKKAIVTGVIVVLLITGGIWGYIHFFLTSF